MDRSKLGLPMSGDTAISITQDTNKSAWHSQLLEKEKTALLNQIFSCQNFLGRKCEKSTKTNNFDGRKQSSKS